MECMRKIAAEAKSLCSSLTKSDTDMRPISNASLFNSINVISSFVFI